MEFRISNDFGPYVVEAKDNNGQWVLAEPGACEFGTREEAEAYIASWSNLNDGYRFATDSESGKIEAGSWNEACQKLHELLPDHAIDNGAWGWVEDHNGERYELGIQ